jgi:putative tricarboxylic transport membrane protein
MSRDINGWRPKRAVDIIAGTPPGGGLDRVARALAKVIAEAKLLDVPVNVINVPGDGARRAWAHVDNYSCDAHVIAISSPNLTTDHLVGLAAFDHSRYTPIATLISEYIAFAVRADSDLHSGADLIGRLGRNPGSVTVALSTALGNPNHVAFAKLTRHAGGDILAPCVHVFDTALDAVADVVNGHADVTAVTAVSVAPEVAAGRLRVIGISAPARLPAPFAAAPNWREQGVDCVIGAWRGVTGPSGINADQVAFWQGVLSAATNDPRWAGERATNSWSPMYLDGRALQNYLSQETADMKAVLGDLGLLQAAKQ